MAGMIGVFDAGLGGLSVLREMQRRLPDRDFVYFGDTARGPFAERSPAMVAAGVSAGLVRLSEMGAGLLVVPDHAAAACLTDDIRERFSIPVLDIVTTGVALGLGAQTPPPRAVGIIGPPVILAAGAHAAAVRETLPGARIFSRSAPLLEPLVTAGWLKRPETTMIVKKYLHFFKLRQVDTLVPGSNHYLLLSRIIRRKMGKRALLLDPAPVFAEGVANFLAGHPEADGQGRRGGTCRALVSDLTPGLEKAARMFYGRNISLEPL